MKYFVAHTLAQRMGLAVAPEPELTQSEWDAIADMSRDRDASKQPCVICCEHFRDEKSFLLEEIAKLVEPDHAWT